MGNLGQGDAEDQQDHQQVQHALHHPGGDLAGEGNLLVPGDQIGAHGLARAAEEHHGGESDAGGRRTPRKSGLGQGPEHDLPAQGAADVGRQDQDQGPDSQLQSTLRREPANSCQAKPEVRQR